MRRLRLLPLLMAIWVGSGSAQIATGAASLSGVVVAGTDAQPVRRVTVTVAGAGLATSRLAITDDRGRFTIANLPAGRFTLTAARPGYLTTSYGATRGWRSPGVPIVVGDGQQVANLTVRLIKGGVITGRVTDPLGQPIEDLQINVGELRSLNGQMTYTSVAANDAPAGAGSGTISTDDRGVYRIYGLPPGAFVVSGFRVNGDPLRTFEPTTAADLEWARKPLGTGIGTTPAPAAPPDAAPTVGYVPVYFPGTADLATATTVKLAEGEERGGVDFAVEAVRFATIAGTVTGAAGDPVNGVMIYAVPVGGVTGAVRGGIPPIGSSDALGQFTLRGVPPGRFSIVAQSRGAAPVFGRTDAMVDGNSLTGVHLTLLPGVPISGRVALDGETAALPAELLRAKIRITAPPAPMGAAIAIPPVDLDKDGVFRFQGVGPGSYVLSVSLPAGDAWMVKSAALGGRDLITTPLDVAPGQSISGIVVTMTDRVTEISGRLLDSTGRPAPDFYVLAYPVDPRLWLLGRERLRAAVRPASDGRYRMAGLRPGEYYLAALPEMQPDDYADPSFLEMLVPASIKITIGEGEKKTQDVRLASGG